MHVSGLGSRRRARSRWPASLHAHLISCGVMKTFRLDPTAGDQATAVVKAVDELLREGKRVVVAIAEAQERDGRVAQRELGSLRDFPTALIEARIVAGLTQKQLGERLEVKEQQIQRWEANLYSGVGVERLQEVADALGMEVKVIVDYAATRITVRPDQMDGAPCVRGLRIPVATVIDMVAEGMNEGEIVAAYPDLEAADVRAVIYRYRPQRNRDRNFALAGNFERIDRDSRSVSESLDDASARHG
jgi:uncharacterized protein (DUF433 family)